MKKHGLNNIRNGKKRIMGKSTQRITDEINICPGCGCHCLAGRSFNDHVYFCPGVKIVHSSTIPRNHYSRLYPLIPTVKGASPLGSEGSPS